MEMSFSNFPGKTKAIFRLMKHNCALCQKENKPINVHRVLAATVDHLLQHGVIYHILTGNHLTSKGI